jgi:MoxR-like ATPase
VHDALKRRCLYQWIEYPSLEKEIAIVRARVPQAAERLAAQVTRAVQEIRRLDLYKVPGVSETLDWVAAVAALDREVLDLEVAENTIGVVLKSKDDQDAVRGAILAGLIERATGPS